MAIFSVGGSASGPNGTFNWSATYNDQGNGTVTIAATGPTVGRGLAIITTDDGRAAAIYFKQDLGQERYPLPAGTDVVVEREHVLNGANTVISPAHLRVSPPGNKPGAVGGFDAQTFWSRF